MPKALGTSFHATNQGMSVSLHRSRTDGIGLLVHRKPRSYAGCKMWGRGAVVVITPAMGTPVGMSVVPGHLAGVTWTAI